MKKIGFAMFFVLGLVLSQFLMFTSSAQHLSKSEKLLAAKRAYNRAVFAQVCQTIKPLENALLKSTAGGHISRKDRRYYGFAFICGKECVSKFPVQAYYSDGTPAFKLGYYGRWNGNGQPRAYCGSGGAPKCVVATVKRLSNLPGRDGKVYLDFGNGVCQSATPGIRNGNTF